MNDQHDDHPDGLINFFNAPLASHIAHPELGAFLKHIKTSDGTSLADKTMAEGLIMVGKAEGLMLEYPGESYRPPQVAAIITDGKLAEAALSLPANNSELSEADVDRLMALLADALSESENPPVMVLESYNNRGKNTVRRLLAFASAGEKQVSVGTGERRFWKLNPQALDPAVPAASAVRNAEHRFSKLNPKGHDPVAPHIKPGVLTIIFDDWVCELDESNLTPEEIATLKFLATSKGKRYRIPCNDSPAATGTAQTGIPKEPTDGRLYWVRGFYEKPRKVDAETARRMLATGQTRLCTPVMDDEDGEQG